MVARWSSRSTAAVPAASAALLTMRGARIDRPTAPFSWQPANWAGDCYPPRVEETLEDSHRWVEHQSTASGDAPQDRSMRYRAFGIPAAPQRPAHVPVSTGHGRDHASSITGTPPVGFRQRGQRHHTMWRGATRSGTNRQPHRRHRMSRLMIQSPCGDPQVEDDRSDRHRPV
jgi:hypothetical protein